MKYPIICYGMKFDKGDDFHDWINGLYKKQKLSEKEWLIIVFTYDNGFLAHPDYKYLKRKHLEHNAQFSHADEC